MPKLSNGLLITFEGGEGAGKTTLINGIARELTLRGYLLVRTREPGGTTIGEQIRSILLQHSQGAPLTPQAELCLFLASRAQHIAEVIRPALLSGKIVLCDRFNDSTIAYQGMGRKLGYEKVSDVCRFICQDITPQLTLYLDIDPQIGLERASRSRTIDRIESEKIAFHETVRQAFRRIHAEDPKRFNLLDANQSPALLLSEAMNLITPLLNK